MNNDNKKKLSTKELMRRERFHSLCRAMKREGYKVRFLSCYKFATVASVISLSAPFAYMLTHFYILNNPEMDMSPMLVFVPCLFAFLMNMGRYWGQTFGDNVTSYPFNLFFFLLSYVYFYIYFYDTVDNRTYLIIGGIISYICSMLLFEMMHKWVFSLFTKGGEKDVELVLSSKRLTSFTVTFTPLSKMDYICATLIPLALTLIIALSALCVSSFVLYIFALAMIFLSGHDLLLLVRLLTHWEKGEDVRYIDHPYGLGLVAFVKNRYQK